MTSPKIQLSPTSEPISMQKLAKIIEKVEELREHIYTHGIPGIVEVIHSLLMVVYEDE